MFARDWVADEPGLSIQAATDAVAILEFEGPITAAYTATVRELIDPVGYICQARVHGSEGELFIGGDRVTVQTRSAHAQGTDPLIISPEPPDVDTWSAFAQAIETREPALTHQGQRGGDGRMERRLIANDMVRRHHQQRRVARTGRERGEPLKVGDRIGPGDRFINEQLDAFPRAKKVAIVTKTDSASKSQVAEQLVAVSELREWEAIVPVSAHSRVQLDILHSQLLGLLPTSPPLYDADTTTDETLEKRIAELIREAALEGVSDELPHSLAVTIDDIVDRDDKDLVEIYANVWVERDSQKGIIIGKGGARLQEVGARARAAIEPLIGSQVFLSLRVKVAKEWQRDPKQLGRLGF